MENNFQHEYEDYTFRGKRKQEVIILILRRHWLVILFRFFPIFLFFIGIVVFNLLADNFISFFQIDIDRNFITLVNIFLYMFFWLGLFITWIDYYFDTWVVTDQRIVNIEQIGLFRREVSELEHSKIQDVTSEIRGIIPTLFKYGYIYIQTAGEKERFVFKQIPRPVKVRNIIMQLQKRAILEEKKKEGEILRGKI